MNKFFVLVSFFTFFIMAFLIAGVMLAIFSVSEILSEVFYGVAVVLALVVLVMWFVKYKSYAKNNEDNEKND